MKLLDQIKGVVSKNPEKLSQGLGKITSQVNQRTNGKYADKLEKVTSTVESKLDQFTDGEAADENVTDIDLTAESNEAADKADDAIADVKDELPK